MQELEGVLGLAVVREQRSCRRGPHPDTEDIPCCTLQHSMLHAEVVMHDERSLWGKVCRAPQLRCPCK